MIKLFLNFLLKKQVKQFIRGLWLIAILIGLVYYFMNPNDFTPQSIKAFMENQGSNLLIFYTLVSFFRGLFLIPSTPLVIAGAIIFPEQLWLVFIISMAGILFSASLIYFASDFLDFDKLFDKIKSKKVQTLRQKINNYGFWVVLVWSFFPLVPTDLICYIAGTIKMSYYKFILALFIGESILVAIYLFLGDKIEGVLF
jgi:uncharacterized membrane protein YdjX (TVP38/TMEM64 family)